MAFAYVGHTTHNTGSTTGTTIVPSALSVTAGDLVVFFARWETDDTGSTTISISDDLSSTWTGPYQVWTGSSTEDQHIGMFWTTAPSTGSMTATGTLSVTEAYRRGWLANFSGSGSYSLVDHDNDARSTNGATWSTPALSVSTGDLVVLGLGEYNQTAVPVPDSPLVEFVDTTLVLGAGYYYVITSGGTFTPSGTYTANDSFVAKSFAFRETGAAGVSAPIAMYHYMQTMRL